MNCRKTIKKIPLYASNDLSKKDENLVRSHIEDCPYCQRKFSLYKADRERLIQFRKPYLPKGLLDDFYQEIQRRLKPEKEKIMSFRQYRRILKYAAAAAVIIICVLIFFPREAGWITRKEEPKEVAKKKRIELPIKPEAITTTFYYEENVHPVEDGIGF